MWTYIRNGESVSKLVGLYTGGLYSEVYGMLFATVSVGPYRNIFLHETLGKHFSSTDLPTNRSILQVRTDYICIIFLYFYQLNTTGLNSVADSNSKVKLEKHG